MPAIGGHISGAPAAPGTLACDRGRISGASAGSRIAEIHRIREEDAITEPEMAHEEFRDRFVRLFRKAPAGLVEDYRFVELPAVFLRWTPTGLALEAGNRATAMALCRVEAPQRPGIGPQAFFQTWMRLGPTGTIFCGGRNTHSLAAPKAGELHVAVFMPGEKSARQAGTGEPSADRSRIAGIISIVAVRWKEAPLRSLRYLADAGDVRGLVRAEIGRLCNPVDATEVRPLSAVAPKNPQ